MPKPKPKPAFPERFMLAVHEIVAGGALTDAGPDEPRLCLKVRGRVAEGDNVHDVYAGITLRDEDAVGAILSLLANMDAKIRDDALRMINVAWLDFKWRNAGAAKLAPEGPQRN